MVWCVNRFLKLHHTIDLTCWDSLVTTLLRMTDWPWRPVTTLLSQMELVFAQLFLFLVFLPLSLVKLVQHFSMLPKSLHLKHCIS